MRAEYDFSKGVRGKYAAKYAEGTKIIVREISRTKGKGRHRRKK